jgi:hypothetical protein
MNPTPVHHLVLEQPNASKPALGKFLAHVNLLESAECMMQASAYFEVQSMVRAVLVRQLVDSFGEVAESRTCKIQKAVHSGLDRKTLLCDVEKCCLG